MTVLSEQVGASPLLARLLVLASVPGPGGRGVHILRYCTVLYCTVLYLCPHTQVLYCTVLYWGVHILRYCTGPVIHISGVTGCVPVHVSGVTGCVHVSGVTWSWK